MKPRTLALVVLIGSGLVYLASARWSVLAQDRGARRPAEKAEVAPTASVQEAMLRPFDLPFGEETSLEDVRKHLAKTLKAPVVLDLAALDLLELTPDDVVQLDLRGVRLKVGLKLLLDQVGLSYKVVPEDNLLILTDPAQSGDPTERTLAEIKELHRDLHSVQEAVDDLRDLVEEELGYGPDTGKDGAKTFRIGSKRPGRRDPDRVRSRVRAAGARG